MPACRQGDEGLPRAILEAAACGRAILTTDVPGCRDLGRDGLESWLAPPYGARAIAERICALAQDRQLLGQASVDARQRIASDFAEAHVMAQVLALYQSFAAKPA